MAQAGIHSIVEQPISGDYWFFVSLLGLILIALLVKDQEDLGWFVLFVSGAVSCSFTLNLLGLAKHFSSLGMYDMQFFSASLILGIPFGGLGGIILCNVIRWNTKIAVLGGIIVGIFMIQVSSDLIGVLVYLLMGGQ